MLVVVSYCIHFRINLPLTRHSPSLLLSISLYIYLRSILFLRSSSRRIIISIHKFLSQYRIDLSFVNTSTDPLLTIRNAKTLMNTSTVELILYLNSWSILLYFRSFRGWRRIASENGIISKFQVLKYILMKRKGTIWVWKEPGNERERNHVGMIGTWLERERNTIGLIGSWHCCTFGMKGTWQWKGREHCWYERNLAMEGKGTLLVWMEPGNEREGNTVGMKGTWQWKGR